MTIQPVTTGPDLHAVHGLFVEYATSLSFSLCFQNFQAELDGLPGRYAPPQGGLWLATSQSGDAAGCVGLRFKAPGIGEMKRLYVRPTYRGTGLGRLLVNTVLKQARDIGYERIQLDTTADMTAAIRLYESLGFTRMVVDPPNLLPDAVDMELLLNPAGMRT